MGPGSTISQEPVGNHRRLLAAQSRHGLCGLWRGAGRAGCGNVRPGLQETESGLCGDTGKPCSHCPHPASTADRGFPGGRAPSVVVTLWSPPRCSEAWAPGPLHHHPPPTWGLPQLLRLCPFS